MEYDTRQDFADVLAEQLRRAPYIVASMVVHFGIALLVAGIMLLQEKESAVPVMAAAPAPPPPDIEVPEEPEDIPPIEPEPIETPIVNEVQMDDQLIQELEDIGDPNQDAESPFENKFDNADIGIGGPPGGNGGNRGSGSGAIPKNTEAAVQDALQWLADHQATSGYWDADDFMLMDRYANQPSSTGKGNPVVDVGLTGLALLAFEARNNSMNEGPFADNVSAGVNWLKAMQRDDGLIGDEVGNPTLYNHAIATMALGEAYRLSNRSPVLKRPLQRATATILNAQNNYQAWRYKLESNGDNDSSITGWMVFALKTADAEGIPIDKGSYGGAATWFNSMEDKNTGRVGYTFESGPGSLPSRPAIYLDKFPAEKSEALTAVALLCRLFMTDGDEVHRWEDHPQYESLRKQADLVRAKLPNWDEEDGSIDMYYWYYGTFAMNQWGGRHWKEWEKALGKALLPNQRRDAQGDNFYGSWDPVGPWGEEGGRIYSTAICTLMLQVYYRYARVLGAR